MLIYLIIFLLGTAPAEAGLWDDCRELWARVGHSEEPLLTPIPRESLTPKQRWVGDYGQAALPVVKDTKGKKFIRIGEDLYPAWQVRYRGAISWEMEVPIESIHHAAWNPVSPEKIMDMAKAGVRSPREYQATVGVDGRIYLLDGNHRLRLDGRKKVRVIISDPPATTNFRNTLDLVGVRQPSSEEAEAIVRGVLSWEEFLRRQRIEPFPLMPGNP